MDRRISALLVLLVALAGCDIRLEPPADWPGTTLSLVSRNESGKPYGYWVRHGPAGEGGGGALGGHHCSPLLLPWTLTVGIDEGFTDPAVQIDPSAFKPILSSGAGGPARVEVWVDVRPDGTVVVGHGIPEWADPGMTC